MKRLTVKEITKETFLPYGRLIEEYGEIPTKSGEGWKCFSDVERIYPNAPLMAGIVYCTKVPEVITGLEAHTSREELLWATDKDIIMVVSQPFDLKNPKRQPDVNYTEAFLIKAGQAVIMSKGTWHSPAFSYDGTTAKYFFLVEMKKDDIDQDAAPWISFKEENYITVLK